MAMNARALASLSLLLLASCASEPLIPVREPLSGAEAMSEGPRPWSTQSEAPAVSSPDTPPPATASVDPTRIEARRARLDAALRPQRLARSAISAVVIDLESGEEVYGEEADAARIPASNNKLFTTAATLALLGPEHTMQTRVLASSEPSPSGEVETLYLVGGHDLGWSKVALGAPDGPLARLAREVRAKGIVSVRKELVVLGDPIVEPQRFSELDLSAHRKSAAARFRKALTKAGVKVGRARVGAGEPPAQPVIAALSSAPVIEACTTINQFSHNQMADVLLLHLGLTQRGEASYEAGAAVVSTWLRAIGVGGSEFSMHDGSGLSRANRTSARTLASLLRYAAGAPWGEAYRATMTVAGERGTLAARLKEADTLGRIAGKTGSLSDVASLSGYLTHRHDGRTYAFSLLFNDVRDLAAARATEDRFLEELAAAW